MGLRPWGPLLPCLAQHLPGWHVPLLQTRGHTLVCSARLKGCSDQGLPTAHLGAGLRRLQSLPRGAVHRVRLLSIVGAGEQSWTTAGPAGPAAATAQVAPPSAAAAPGPQRELSKTGSEDGTSWWRKSAAVGSPPPAAAPPDALAAPPAADAAAGQLALPPGGHLAQQEQQAPGSADAGGGAPQLLLWGELYARERRRGLAALLPQRRADIGERLVAAVRSGGGWFAASCCVQACRNAPSWRHPCAGSIQPSV